MCNMALRVFTRGYYITRQGLPGKGIIDVCITPAPARWFLYEMPTPAGLLAQPRAGFRR